jgi:two-component system, LytTR family, response regulator
MIHTAIVDDEPLARTHLRRMLDAEPDVKVVGESADVADAIITVRDTTPDLLFLDVQLRGATGFDVLAALDPARRPLVVFVTAYDEHALHAFDVHALDYLLKPFDRPRLQRALDRARASLATRGNQDVRLTELLSALQSARAEPPLEHLLVKIDGRTIFVRLAEIEWVDASHNHVVLHVGEQSYKHRESLNSLETRLDSSRFVRVHRSTIVNIDYVAEMQPWFGGDNVLIMRRGQRLRVGRHYRDVWRRW